MKEKLVLFVCTGNICRSPMAEYMLRTRLGKKKDWITASAGVAACQGMPASRHGVFVLQKLGIDMRDHRSQPVTADLIDSCTVVVVMSESHRQQLRMLFPASREKVFLLRSFDPFATARDVMDPIGGSVDTYRRVSEDIEAALPGLVAFLSDFEL